MKRFILAVSLVAVFIVACNDNKPATKPEPQRMVAQQAPAGGPAEGVRGQQPMNLPPGHPPIGDMPAPGGAPGGMAMTAPAPTGLDSAGGVKWTKPERWMAGKPSPMRAATYLVPTEGGGDPSECAVFFFGSGQGGSIDANFARWIGQFKATPESDPAKTAKKEDKKFGEFTVHLLDVSGTFMKSAAPMMGGATTDLPNYRMLGAVIDAPQGMVFFKLTGPAAGIEKAAAEFDAVMKSLVKG